MLVACCSAVPETCRAERTQINTQLHQVGKSFHISNQNTRYTYPSRFKFYVLEFERSMNTSIDGFNVRDCVFSSKCRAS